MTKIYLQSPFRETKLLSATWFQSYCRDNGANLFSGDLEQLRKEGLFYPAVKVYRGTCEMRKIYAQFNGSKNYEWRYVGPNDIEKFHPKKVTEKPYYMTGSFFLRNGWLDYYKTNGMLEYPAGQKFVPWDKTLYEDFGQNRKLLEKQSELFYDPLQLIPLKVILKERASWKFIDKARAAKERQALKKHLSEINNFLAFYVEAEKIVLEEKLKQNEYIEKRVSDGIKRKDIVKELREENAFIIGLLVKQAKGLVADRKVDTEYIERWQHFLARFSVIGEARRSSKYLRTYLKAMSESSLMNAEEINRMIYVLNRFTFFTSGKQKTVKQILEYSELPRCTVCENYFSPKKLGQKTCGRKECIRRHKNALKRKNRAKIRG